ncbi:MAG: chromosome segregation protein SMC [Planctomycetes bacterium]|nr:chromosome segregation protein SMC [Planctomycetota bacterium]
MRLKRLVARGFKSFADRTELEFDSRLTGIIGPNGCGKSNVVDAIRWVLGDQRAKSLRGTEMTDVIFKGAEGREAMGMAEVTITFEDPEGRIDGRTEVDISRRLTLDKESAYLLNGSEVRLKDVRDVLLDTGLGTGGYSVMEQGRIDAVLSADPEARRAIFEEAAGVSRFKLQKRETLRKLERTDQNLARITDLLEERARHIRGLRIQAGKARRWQELQAALRDLRAALAVIDGQALRAELVAHAERLAELQYALTTADEGRDGAAERLAQSDETITAASAALGRVQDELRQCQGELTTHRERADAQKDRATALAEELERGRQRTQGLVDQRNERANELARARDGLVGKEEELVELHRQLEDQRHAAQQALQALRQMQKERDVVRERQLELLHARTRSRNAAADAKATRGAAEARAAKLTERQGTLADERARLDGEADGWRAEQRDAGTRLRLLQEREQSALADLQDADAAAAAMAEREALIRRELHEVEGRRQALLGMEAHMEGFDQGPRHVLQQKPPGLRGRLLDLIEIDVRHGQALEAALGPFVQALVVDTREHATAIVRELAEKRLGRVLLLVEESFGEAPPCASHSTLLKPPDGVRYLSELVRHVVVDGTVDDAASSRLLGWLLRGVVVADFDVADSARADLCFVTPEGTLVCGPRMEGGASAEGHTGLVVRRSQIQDLGAQAAAVAARLQELQAGKEQATGRVDRLKRELKAVGDALAAATRELQAAQGQQARLEARLGDVAREVGELADEAAELSATRAGALARLSASLFDQHLLGQREAAAQAEEQAFGDRIAVAERDAQGQQAAEQDLRVRQATVTQARATFVAAIKMHEDALRDSERSLQELGERQLDAEASRQRSEAERDRLIELAAALEDRFVVLEGGKGEAQTGVDAARAARATVQAEAQSWEARRSAANEALTQTRLRHADAEHRFLRLEERLREDAGIEVRRCLGEIEGLGLEDQSAHHGPIAPLELCEQLQGPPLPPEVVQAWHGLQRLWERDAFDQDGARKDVQRLQSQKERLGAVNLDAVKELDQEEGQFSTLEVEVADLKEARRSLMETLKKLEAESKTLFERTFHEARKNFQEIFRKLFQGGKADMFLSHNVEDMLEAGIEIVAQPPGKQLQSIRLLSGGERSLTAVAILFALFKVRPSPFCILDEVDAALDETNVERFLRVLRDFTSQTQFCIVTHHKRTMAECQVLYGITMQRRGVSSRIAVSLQEVDSIQQPESPREKSDVAFKRRIAGEEAVGFA